MEGWIAVSRVASITNKPQVIKFRNKKYVTYRHNDTIEFFPDSCKHRGMSLSKGKVQPDGKLECPYHGWTYDSKEFCRPDHSMCQNYEEFTMQQSDGLLWIQPKVQFKESLPMPPLMPKTAGKSIWFETLIDAPAQLIIENGIDPNHASWVHAHPLGFGVYKQLPRDLLHFEDNLMFYYTPRQNGLSSMMLDIKDTHNFHSVVYPYTTWSDVDIPGGYKLTTFVTLCPETHQRTKMFVGFSHNTMLPDFLLLAMGRAIVEQDRAILENLNLRFVHDGIPGLNDELIEQYRRTLKTIDFK